MEQKRLAVIILGILPVVTMLALGQIAHANQLYGPVKAQDTLWGIADRSRPDNSITVQQMMAAIRDYNPQAFINGDIHTLQKDAMLYLPNKQEIQLGQSVAIVPDRPLPANANRTQLRHEINSLRKKLKQEQSRSQELLAQLRLKQQESQALSTRLEKLQTEQTTTATDTGKQPSASGTAEKEMVELKQLLDERDIHIQHLQASLREASIAIKRQYAESVALHQQLKALDPNNQETIPPPPEEINADGTTPAKAGLTLQGTEEQAQSNTDANVAPDGVSVQQWLEQQQAASQPTGEQAPKMSVVTMPSRVSVAVALLAVLFIAALWWRNKAQQRALQREEDELRIKLAVDVPTKPNVAFDTPVPATISA